MNGLNVRFALFARKIDGIKYDARKKLEALQADLAKPLPIEVKYQEEAPVEYADSSGEVRAAIQQQWLANQQANFLRTYHGQAQPEGLQALNRMAFNQNAKPYQSGLVDRLSVLGNLGL